jgi:hypothetical protein
MLWIVEIDIGIAKVELESCAEIRIPRTSVDFGQGVSSKRIDAAERHESAPESLYLARGPIVFSLHLGVFILYGGAVRVPELEGQRKDYSPMYARRIHLGDQVASQKGLGLGKNARDSGT